jgi:hypothetical protein
MIRRTASVAFAIALAAMLLASLAGPAAVVAADPPAQLRLDVQPGDGGFFSLRATLTRAGAVQSQETVQFLQFVDFFGERWVPIGTAVTDAAGVASLRYSPTSNGHQELMARYAGVDGTVASDPFEITVSGAVPAIPEEPPVLPVVRAWAFPVGAAVLFLVWLLLAVILLRAVIGIARPTEMRATGSTLPAAADGVPQPPRSKE